MSSYTIFTAHERARAARENKYGTQTVKLTEASFPEVDECGICNASAKEPLVCSEGHLFCKACVYEYLLHQKSKAKQVAHDVAVQESEAAQRARAEELKSEKEKVEQFLHAQTSLAGGRSLTLPASSTGTGADSTAAGGKAPAGPPPGYKEVATADGRTAYVLDSEVIKRHTTDAGAGLSAEERQAQLRVVPAFWVPAVAPTAAPAKAVKMDHIPCPRGAHPLKMKQLRPVRLTPPSQKQKEDMKVDGKGARFVCAACSKLLTKSIKSVCLRSCGHVICGPCAHRFLPSERACPACDTPATDADAVTLTTGAAGFAASGAAEAKKRVNPAFQS